MLKMTLTVKELTSKLSGFPPNTPVCVLFDNDKEQTIFDITDVEFCTGDAKRVGNKARFVFKTDGKATRAFISVEEA